VASFRVTKPSCSCSCFSVPFDNLTISWRRVGLQALHFGNLR
jgi:hypothetical protein